MTRLIYQVAVGPPSRLYEFCTDSVRQYAARVGADYVIQTEPILRVAPDPARSGRSDGATRLGYLPIFEKENALRFVGAYDQVAVLDADVWVRPGADSIFEAVDPGVDFAGVVERDMPITPKYERKLVAYTRGQYLPLDDVDWRWDRSGAEFFNMGVMVLNARIQRLLRGQTPAQFLARPEFRRFVDGVGHWKWSTDQTLLNWWLRSEKAKLQKLPYVWNALYGALDDGALDKAQFVHFFLREHLPERGENVAELVQRI